MQKAIVLNTKDLYFDKENKCFSGEASDIGQIHVALWGMQLTKINWQLRSQRTGALSKWEFRKEHRNADGDATHWEFAPTLESWTRFPELAGYRFVIFND